MTERPNPDERHEGIDRTVLDEDVWTEKPAKSACPKCGLAVEPGMLRCPRCNALLIMAGCGGSCASCGANACARRED